jgi:hypothetical protein
VPGLDAKLQALAQLFELAATATHVDHPLCLDCAQQLREEVESQVGRSLGHRLGWGNKESGGKLLVILGQGEIGNWY